MDVRQNYDSACTGEALLHLVSITFSTKLFYAITSMRRLFRTSYLYLSVMAISELLAPRARYSGETYISHATLGKTIPEGDIIVWGGHSSMPSLVITKSSGFISLMNPLPMF